MLAELARERAARGFAARRRRVELLPEGADGAVVPVCVVERSGEAIGSVVWGSSLDLCAALARDPAIVRGKTVLELGAGVGLCGIAAAALGAQRVVLTDREPLLKLLRESVGANEPDTAARCEVAALEWGEVGARSAPAVDLVIAADVVYRRETLPDLAATFSVLCGRGAVGMLAYQPRRPDDEAVFFDEARRLGLSVELERFAEGGGDGDGEGPRKRDALVRSPFQFAKRDQGPVRLYCIRARAE